ncbi:MAG: RluA family pseudouridine synthase [Candidatus Baltobacteraceae bacterium]
MTPTHVVGETEAGLRTDVVVARAANASRSLVTEAIRRGQVTRNGEPVKGAAAVEPGDLLAYTIEERAPLVARAETHALAIVYEDDDVLVVDKPAGMVTHPAPGAREGTLANALLGHIAELPGEPLRPGLVHRLDRDTSGLLVVAKTPEALRALGKAMQRRFVERTYLGLVHGIPERERGTIEGAIGRDQRNRLRYAIRAEGKPAVTHYEVRERLRGASELIFRLETGRTHQIRVHLLAFGHPVVGDPVYGRGDARVDLEGQALHAWRLSFRHPRTHEDLTFEREPPAAYLRARDALRG